MPARLLVKLPDAISFEQAAAAMLKGCTAEFLIERCARVQRGQTVLVHAAAGGVGSIAVQWLKAIGATVIAHSGNAAKAAVAIELGADVSLDVPMEALAERVREHTDGNGVPVVLDGVGAASWEASLALGGQARADRQLRQCLRPGAALRDARAVAARFLVRHPADPVRLLRDAGRHAGLGGAAVRDDRLGQGRRADRDAASRWPKPPTPIGRSKGARRRDRRC